MARHDGVSGTRTGRVRIAAAGCVLLLVAACGVDRIAGSPAALASRPDVSGIQLQDTASVSLRKTFNESPQAVNDYWTRKRIDDAKPKTPPVQPTPPPTTPAPGTPTAPPTQPSTRPSTAPPTTYVPPAPQPSQKPGRKDPTTDVTIIRPSRGTPKNVLLTNSTSGARWNKNGLTGSTNGRLYFVVDNEDWVCSATVVHSTSKDVVSTAGHCVWDTETGKGWSQKMLFIPADDNDGESSPYGRWTVQRMWAPDAFLKTATATGDGVQGDGWQVDFAFLKMNKLNGKKIESVTGGQGIAFGTDVNSILDIGYPTAAPFDGTSERYCSAQNFDVVPEKFYDRVITCAMTAGCSGGSWLTDFNPADGSGYVIGVNSIGGRGYMYSAQFGAAALSAYNSAVAGKT